MQPKEKYQIKKLVCENIRIRGLKESATKNEALAGHFSMMFNYIKQWRFAVWKQKQTNHYYPPSFHFGYRYEVQPDFQITKSFQLGYP